jgi:hypothetical protein
MILYITVTYRKDGQEMGVEHSSASDWKTARLDVWKATLFAESEGLEVIWDIEDNSGERDSGSNALVAV